MQAFWLFYAAWQLRFVVYWNFTVRARHATMAIIKRSVPSLVPSRTLSFLCFTCPPFFLFPSFFFLSLLFRSFLYVLSLSAESFLNGYALSPLPAFSLFLIWFFSLFSFLCVHGFCLYLLFHSFLSCFFPLWILLTFIRFSLWSLVALVCYLSLHCYSIRSILLFCNVDCPREG